MTYYFNKIMNFDMGEAYAPSGTLSQAEADAAKEKYPMFVPVASVYQVGRSIVRDGVKQYVTTAQPFSYGSGEFTMDFTNKNNFAKGQFNSKALVIPDGFTVTVKSVTQPQSGTVELLAGNKVKYTPANGEGGLYSGNFNVTLGITKDDGAFTVEDVDLVINLKQSANTDLNRTTYTYDTEAQVPSTDSVYNVQTMTFNFGNFVNKETKKNVCTQETNTQIWQAGWNYDDDTYDKNSKNYRVMPNNKTLQMLDGIMYFSGAGTYRFTLKGRGKATLYLSYDNGTTYESALTIARTSGNAYVETEYAEHEFTTTRNYVYFKVVLLVTKESDFFGIGVATKQADGSFSGFANAKDAFTNPSVHRQATEEANKKFQTEYRFKNEYKYDYVGAPVCDVTQNVLVSVSHDPWDANQPITNMFDGNANTYYHSKGGEANYITEAKPFELVVDLKGYYLVNTVTFTGYKNNVGNNGMVKDFKLYGSGDGTNYTLLHDVKDGAANARVMKYSFAETEIRYYKLVVTKTDNERYFAMNKIEFSLSYSGGNHIAPNAEGIRYTGVWNYENVLCNFGSIYTANAGAKVEFTFTGSRFAYFAYHSTDYGTVDIYVDDNKVASDVSLSADNNASSLTYMYLNGALSNGKHVVRIEGKSGKFNVDSFVYWK
ncbi:MAG: discoidin domain-containing protein [Clostridiales bacterium]|nr:discoidin domain-containing protein [Clostridiales bacterium]